MNTLELQGLLLGYPVTVCASDQIKVRKGQFVFANTDARNGPGKHWVVFYFPTEGPFEFFDSLGQSPEDYNVNFETVLAKDYWRCFDRLQEDGSDVCGLYCVYYVKTRCKGLCMKDIVKPFHIHKRTLNDQYVKHFCT